MEPWRGKAEDPTFCDGHAGFRPDQIPLATDWLRRGIRAGLLGEEDRAGDPALIWAPSNMGWIFEARITIPGQAVYHGYPVLPSEAIATEVLVRYQEWVRVNGSSQIEDELNGLRSRYR